MKPKLLIILGPTATGKSNLAVILAKKFNGEVISADSRQVYKGLNLGTGKITKKEMQGVKHYLLDVVLPKKVFTVSEYQKLASKAIEKIIAKGKLPIICGGTGLYIDSVISGASFPEVPPNLKLRKQLEKKTASELFSILQKADVRRAGEIDKNNPRRLIRAIEIVKALGKVPEIKSKESRYDVLKIGLNLTTEKLKKRISIRLFARIRDGMISEAKRLHKQGLSWKRMEDLGLEYRYQAKYLKGEISKEEMIKQLELAIWHYVKRQMTWFKKDKDIKWFESKDLKTISQLGRKFLQD